MFFNRFIQFLLPSVWRAALSVGVLPLTTLVLNPQDYGALALVMGLAGFFSSLGAGGIVYLLSGNFAQLSSDDRCGLVSSVMWCGLAIGSILAVFFAVLSPMLLTWIGGDQFAVSGDAICIGSMVVFLSAPWTILATISAVTGESRAFAGVSLAEGTIIPIITLIALYIFKIEGLSLFYGSLGGSLVSALGSMRALRYYLKPVIQRRWLDSFIKTNLGALPGTISEQMRSVIERAVIAKYIGLSSLGIYTHSWSYGNMVRLGTKSLANSLWSISLDEAREKRGAFPKTRQGWSFAHFAISLIGMFFATLGRDFINLLTHSKFTDAYVLATLWMILVLFENSGKPAIARILSDGRQAFHQAIIFGSNITALFILLVLPQHLGMWGVAVALFAQTIIVRGGLAMFLLSNQDIPFQDWGVIVGSILVGLFLAVTFFFETSLFQRIALFFAGTFMLVVYFWATIINFMSVVWARVQQSERAI